MQGNQDDPKETPKIRTRQQMAKGKGFHIKLLKDHTASAQRAWRKQLNKIENALVDSKNALLLQSERILFKTKMEILVDAHNTMRKRSKIILMRTTWQGRNLKPGNKNTQTH